MNRINRILGVSNSSLRSSRMWPSMAVLAGGVAILGFVVEGSAQSNPVESKPVKATQKPKAIKPKSKKSPSSKKRVLVRYKSGDKSEFIEFDRADAHGRALIRVRGDVKNRGTLLKVKSAKGTGQGEYLYLAAPDLTNPKRKVWMGLKSGALIDPQPKKLKVQKSEKWVQPEVRYWKFPETEKWIYPQFKELQPPKFEKWFQPEIKNFKTPKTEEWVYPELKRLQQPQFEKWVFPKFEAKDFIQFKQAPPKINFTSSEALAQSANNRHTVNIDWKDVFKSIGQSKPKNKLVNVDLVDEDFATAIQAVARPTGASFVLAPGDFPKVTLKFVDQTETDAFNAICFAGNATWRKEGNVYYIEHKKPAL